jgi:hypothetical protein
MRREGKRKTDGRRTTVPAGLGRPRTPKSVVHSDDGREAKEIAKVESRNAKQVRQSIYHWIER